MEIDKYFDNLEEITEKVEIEKEKHIVARENEFSSQFTSKKSLCEKRISH